MAKIPFDIKFRPQIESGEYKVITAKEQPVRIICWDRSTTYWKIIALVLAPDGRTENPFTYDVDGKESDGCLHNYELDLFIITPEPELSEFEEAVGAEIFDPPFNEEQIKVIKEESAKLLELAKAELTRQANIVLTIEEFEKRHMEAQDAGRKEALKGLPRWVDDGLQPGCGAIDISGLCGFDFLRRNGRLLSVSSIEKLPGFKEDEK